MNKLRVWHIPNVLMGVIFYVSVKNIDEAILVLNCLSEYDAYEYENDIKSDYSNAQGLEEYGFENENGEHCWAEWHSDGGEDVWEYMYNLED